MANKDRIRLQPCPFCGNSITAFVDDFGKYGINCSNCKLMFGITVESGVDLVHGWKAEVSTPEELAEKWNRRVNNGDKV